MAEATVPAAAECDGLAVDTIAFDGALLGDDEEVLELVDKEGDEE